MLSCYASRAIQEVEVSPDEKSVCKLINAAIHMNNLLHVMLASCTKNYIDYITYSYALTLVQYCA